MRGQKRGVRSMVIDSSGQGDTIIREKFTRKNVQGAASGIKKPSRCMLTLNMKSLDWDRESNGGVEDRVSVKASTWYRADFSLWIKA